MPNCLPVSQATAKLACLAFRLLRSSGVDYLRRGNGQIISLTKTVERRAKQGLANVIKHGARAVRIGVDVGGTFTDLQILDARTGRMTSLKTPTTPDDPSIGLMTGVKRAAERDGFALGDVGYLLHGTTIATNAVLERKLPAAALVTTQGFEDVLEIGRHYRREVYSLNPLPPPALIERDLRFGIAERILADGRIETPLTKAAIDSLTVRLGQLDLAAVAICFLNSYLMPEHEQRLAEHLARALPHLRICCSSGVSPEIREYERTSTTVLNALLMPVVTGYIDRLQRRMAEEKFAPRLLIVQSNGGVCSAETAAREPVRLLLSGPSGGSAASALLGRRLGEPNLVGMDMGGTSFDVSVVRNGIAGLVAQGEIDRLPVRLPMVDVRTIGAGGGSLACVLPDGRLAVGPESAGAKPGPVAYGRGGTEPTVTDANVVLGRLDAGAFLGGDMQLDLGAARTAIEAKIARPLGLELEPAADGLLRLMNTKLGAAIRLSLFEKGLDPREFALIAFGGAAGLHATDVAEELNVTRVIFPKDASTFSAFGILNSDLQHDLVRSRLMPLTPDAAAALAPIAEELRREAGARLDSDAVPIGDRDVRFTADVRYKGQAFELTVGVPGTVLDRLAAEQLMADFHALHRQRFSYANEIAPLEIVSLRAAAIGRLTTSAARTTQSAGSGRPSAQRRIWIGGSWQQLPVWQRCDVTGSAIVCGPAIVEEAYTTIVLSPGWTCRPVQDGHLIATKD